MLDAGIMFEILFWEVDDIYICSGGGRGVGLEGLEPPQLSDLGRAIITICDITKVSHDLLSWFPNMCARNV